jgi:hypothetical protein
MDIEGRLKHVMHHRVLMTQLFQGTAAPTPRWIPRWQINHLRCGCLNSLKETALETGRANLHSMMLCTQNRDRRARYYMPYYKKDTGQNILARRMQAAASHAIQQELTCFVRVVSWRQVIREEEQQQQQRETS